MLNSCHGQRFKKFVLLPGRVGLLSFTQHNQSWYITTGLEIKTFGRVYVKLELLLNETFVAYETMIKILATL